MKNVWAYDTETTGLELHRNAELFAWSVCNTRGETEIDRVNGSPQKARARLSDWFFNVPAVTCHNARFDLTASENFIGRRLGGPGIKGPVIHDTHKMSHILQNHHQTHSLDNIAWELAGYERVDGQIKKIAASLGGFHKVPRHIMEKYQRLDAERAMALYLFFWPKIEANPRWKECYQTEIDVIWPTMRMEKRGLMVDIPRTRKMISDLESQVETAREEIFRIVGRRFNPDSDPQLRKVLYGTGKGSFGFPILGVTDKSKEPALDKHVLGKLRAQTNHPIFDAILKARSYAHGIVTLQSYLDIAGSEGVIHPTINTCTAITSRQSCENPNLQNVQKAGRVDTPYPVLARNAFRPRPGYVNLHIDYSGIEMRLIVHYSGEPEMVKCMAEGDGDVHNLAAEAYYGDAYRRLPKGPERKMIRDRAKQASFAQAYGASAAKLAVTLGLSPREGAAAHARYRARFPKIGGLSKTISETVRAQGYVDTVFGRRLHVPKGEAYIGTNYLIQGTAAEILKRAEIAVDHYNYEATGDEVKCLLPVHDELISEYPRARLGGLGGYLKEVRKLMTDFPQFSVPLEVEASTVTASWERGKPFPIPR